MYKQAETNGGHDIDVHSEVEDVRVNTLISAEERYFLESHVRAKAIGCAYKAYMNK